jgi:Glycosyl hydrolase family 79 C-terminal beta domain
MVGAMTLRNPLRRAPAGRGREHAVLATIAAGAVLVAVLVGGLAAVLVGGVAARGDAGDRAAQLPQIRIAGTPVGRSIAPGFVGLSIEYRAALPFFGGDPRRPDPVFIALVRQLAPGTAPVLRFGGDSTDWTWWPVRGAPRPPGVTHVVGPRWTAVTRATADALGARLIIGINLEADNRVIAATEARKLLAGLGAPRVAAFELGNEPEVYGALGWYQTAAGVQVPGRPHSYHFAAFLGDFARVREALPATVPLAGPASGAPEWLAGLGRYLADNPRVRLATFHRYPLARCTAAPGSPTSPSIAHLLSLSSSRGLAASLGPAVAAAAAHGVPLRVDELNSVSCGGARGVSDAFASALWSLDTLFALAHAGVQGVNVHTFNTAVYAPFVLHAGRRGWSAQVRPMYYGLLAFARAAPAGARLLATAQSRSSGLRTWATRARGGLERVVLINVSDRRARTVSVDVSGDGTASLTRLTAPSLRARRDIRLGGQSFGAHSATGRLTGRPRTSPVAGDDGRYVVTVPAGSAAILTLPR